VYIAEKLSGKSARVAMRNLEDHFLITGSIISEATRRSIIWGAGIAYRSDVLAQKPKHAVMVRGKYTNDLLAQNGCDPAPVLGDPAYILKKIYAPDITKKYRVGVIPHWVDQDIAASLFGGNQDIAIIDLMRPTEEVVDNILECEACISSSLHGIIASHAYGIPCLWVEFSDRILGDGTKYFDYFSSVSIEEYAPLRVSERMSINQLLRVIPNDVGDVSKADKIFNSCPFMKHPSAEKQR